MTPSERNGPPAGEAPDRVGSRSARPDLQSLLDGIQLRGSLIPSPPAQEQPARFWIPKR